jgi:V-type H+-transporting ATPase subunit C
MQLWLVTIPNNRDTSESVCATLRSSVPNCKIHKFEVPSLVVGTLDSLMALSDDLNKINLQVEVKGLLESFSCSISIFK